MMPPLQTAVSTRAALLTYKKEYGKHQTEEKQTNQSQILQMAFYIYLKASCFQPCERAVCLQLQREQDVLSTLQVLSVRSGLQTTCADLREGFA